MANAQPYKNTEQVSKLLSHGLRKKVKESGERTMNLGNWLVAEAERLCGVGLCANRYRFLGFVRHPGTGVQTPHFRPRYVRHYIDLVKIIERAGDGITSVDRELLQELEINVADRREVSAFHARRQIQPGSPLETGNGQHQHFNNALDEVLASLRKL